MFRTGKECAAPGVYRTTDCGYEMTLLDKEQFPECPVHDREVTWTFIKKIDPPKPRKKRKQG